MTDPITCLPFEPDEATTLAKFHAATFPDSRVQRVKSVRVDFPGGRPGRTFAGTDSGRVDAWTEAVNFILNTVHQNRTDRDRTAAIGKGGHARMCRGCKDRRDHSRQSVPRLLQDRITSAARDKPGRAFYTMIKMEKIDMSARQAAVEPR